MADPSRFGSMSQAPRFKNQSGIPSRLHLAADARHRAAGGSTDGRCDLNPMLCITKMILVYLSFMWSLRLVYAVIFLRGQLATMPLFNGPAERGRPWAKREFW